MAELLNLLDYGVAVLAMVLFYFLIVKELSALRQEIFELRKEIYGLRKAINGVVNGD